MTDESMTKAAADSLLARLGLGTPALRAWAAYDWGNSAFATTIMAAFLPVYYSRVVAADLGDHPSIATIFEFDSRNGLLYMVR